MKHIQFDYNYNNKLQSEAFVHISTAPAGGVPESKAKGPITISVIDHPEISVTVELVDICRLNFCQLLSIHTLPSHGMLCDEFAEWWCKKYPNCVSDTAMAVYYYKKIND
jgi:hypothetical protein